MNVLYPYYVLKNYIYNYIMVGNNGTAEVLVFNSPC